MYYMMWSKWREGEPTKSLENKAGNSLCTVKLRALLFPETSGVLLMFREGCVEPQTLHPNPTIEAPLFLFLNIVIPFHYYLKKEFTHFLIENIDVTHNILSQDRWVLVSPLSLHLSAPAFPIYRWR